MSTTTSEPTSKSKSSSSPAKGRSRRSSGNNNNSSTNFSSGRRIFCKSDDTAPAVSKKISMAALPDAHNGFPVRVFCKRKAAVNTAVKATAIATSRLSTQSKEAAVAIVCIPSFRDNRNEVSLYIQEQSAIGATTTAPAAAAPAPASDTPKPTHFNVGAKTDIKIAAGAIAGSARDMESVSLQAIGQDAVFNAIRAVAVAREYLEKDQMDLYTKIEFTEVRLDGRDDNTTAIKITCFVHSSGRLTTMMEGDNGGGVAVKTSASSDDDDGAMSDDA